MARTVRLFIADDQVLFAESLRYVLSDISPSIEVVAVLSDGAQAVELADRSPPDVILMDVRMPVMDGVEATRLIHQRHPDVKIVMLTTFDDDEYIHHAVSHGAVGYLLKSIRPEELAASITAVMAGTTLFTREIGRKILRYQESPRSQ